MPSPKPHEAKDGTITWRVRFRVGTDGTTETFATKKDADRFCKMVEAMGGARARAVMNETEATAVTDILLRDVANKWLEWKGATRPDGTPLRHSSTYTTDRYGQLVRNQILPHLGKRPLNLISHRDVQNWVDLLSDSLAAKTVADAHSVLHGIYKWAGSKAQGLAIVDPCTETVLPKRKKNVAKGLRPSEWRILHQAAIEVSPNAADLLLFLVSSGWRWSEAAAVRSIDVDDYGDKGVWITMGRVMRRGAGGRFEVVEDEAKSIAGMRRIKMSGEAAAMIRRRRANLSPDDLLFTNDAGRKWYYTGFLSRYWSRPVNGRDAAPNRERIPEVAKRLGLTRDVTLHQLRHTHAVLMLLSGESMAAVQKRMGHEDITTTIRVYGSLIADVSDKGLDAFEGLLAGDDMGGLAEAPQTRSLN